MKRLRGTLPKACLFFLVLMILCGVVYPLAMTGISQLVFPDKANGSIIEVNGVKYGSELVGQQFTGKQYLWGRPMNIDVDTFTGKDGNKAMYAWASNKSPAGEELEQTVADRVKTIRAAHPEKAGEPIPVDLVTASGSGLDPHISPAAAAYQAERIANARNLPVDQVEAVIRQYTEGRLFGLLGEERVNVLKVNLALDGILTEE